MKERKPKKKSKKIVPIVAGGIVGILFIALIGYGELTKDDPVEQMIYYPFENGTKKWVYWDDKVPVHTQSGTIWITIEEAFEKRGITGYQTKTIHLNDQSIDYNFYHEDGMGGKSSGKSVKP